ncbi:hypothetical protein RUM8411_01366 [Ruegeria meonggei]|uniref:Uncharacterized protein n=2 Tax=Ruegeria meonggei TaxID=1446476 RepID=A0A1X6YVN5_9RHOB|nr:hypothetical protein RUM8411_01366 [Ruegeria meonggei]
MLSAIISAAGQRYMDIRLKASGGYAVRIVERPGLWMQPSELDKLVADLRQVASKTLPAGELSYGVFAGDRDRLGQSVITLVTRRADQTPVAFNALALMDVDLGHRSEQVLHLGLVMVDPSLRSQGLSWVLYGLTCVLMLFRNGMRPLWISNVTQVPAVVGLVGTGFARVFPTPEGGVQNRRSLLHLLLGRGIMRQHRNVFGVGDEAGFDEDRFVITNAYTGGSDHLKKTLAEAPKHRDQAVNDFCRDQLDYDRGDDILQLGQMDTPTALSYVGRDVPRGSFAALTLAVGAAVLQRLAMPLWQWADTQREFGILRPREKNE